MLFALSAKNSPRVARCPAEPDGKAPFGVVGDDEPMSLRRLKADDREWARRFAGLACYPPGRPPSASDLADPRVTRWHEGWGDELGVGWVEEDRGLIGAAWARRVQPVLVRDAGGVALPELIVAVDPDRRGDGVGRALVSALQDLAIRLRLPGLALTVSPRNGPALSLYENTGFMRWDAARSPLHVMA